MINDQSWGTLYLPYWGKYVHLWIRIHTWDTYCLDLNNESLSEEYSAHLAFIKFVAMIKLFLNDCVNVCVNHM